MKDLQIIRIANTSQVFMDLVSMPVQPWTGPLHYLCGLIAGDSEEESEIMNELKKDLGVDDRRSESSDTRSRSRSRSSDTREEGAKVKSKGGQCPNDLDFDSSDSDDGGGNGLKYYSNVGRFFCTPAPPKIYEKTCCGFFFQLRELI